MNKNCTCTRCGKAMTSDEVGLYRKLYNRIGTQYICIDCIATDLEVSRELLEQKIVEFKAMGCTLFEG